MYRELWNRTPGPAWAKIIGAVVVVAVVVWLLMEVIFPWIGPSLLGTDSVVQ